MSNKNRSRKKRSQETAAGKDSPFQKTLNSGLTSPRSLVIMMVLGVTFFAFSNSIFNGFAYDDTTQILNNTFIRDLGNIPKALVTEAWYWRAQEDKDPNEQDKPSTSYYRPVVMIYLMLMWKLFGAWAPGWHFLNVVLHVLAVYFVFLVIEKITRDIRLSAIASLIFAVHPLRSESVAWVSGVTDPLLAVFMLSSLYFYLRYREDKLTRSIAISLVLFLVAAFIKEPAVALPIVIVAYELFITNQADSFRARIKPAIRYATPFLVVSALYFTARYYALGFALNNGGFKSYSMYKVVLTIPLVIWKYIGLLLWPIDLSLFHATTLVKSPLDVRFILPVLGLIPLAYGLWRLRGSILARFAMLWFAVNLLPVLNLSAFTEDFLVQERYVYLPSIGFSLLVAMALTKVPVERLLRMRNRRLAQATLVAFFVLLLAGKSLAQNATWKDDMTVWRHGAQTASEQSMSHFILGHKYILHTDYVNAASELEQYMKMNPKNVIVISNLAASYVLIYQYQAAVNPATADRSSLDRALELCEKGMNITDTFPPLWDTLGMIYTFDTGLKNYDRAIACFQRGLSLNSENAMINFHLGGTLIKKGNNDAGMRFLKTALALEPGLVDAHKFLAYAYESQGQFKDAINELNIYLQLQPNAPDASRISKDVETLRARLQPSQPQG